METALVFQDNMIIQRDKPFVIWGTGTPGKRIFVKIQGRMETAFVNGNGKWLLKFPALETSFDETMELWDEHCHKVFRQIAVGEVWLAAGQSNMEFFMRYDKDFPLEKQRCFLPGLRFFDYPEVAVEGELLEKDFSNLGFWRRAEPEDLEYFSAVAYYFGKDLLETLHVPVGIIGCNWGGTRAVCWMDEACARQAALPWLEDYEKCLKDGQKVSEARELYRKNPANDRAHPFDDPASDRMNYGITKEELEFFIKFGQDQENPANWLFPEHPWRPCGLYHTMLEKVIPYGIRGVLWYQGESDEAHADIYGRVLRGLIVCWRNAWGEGLPFIIAQLAPFGDHIPGAGDNWPLIRRAQQETSESMENVYIVSTGDVGLPYDIHPKEKRPVGQRMAWMARGKIYKEPFLCEAPRVKAARLLENDLRMTFDNCGTGLWRQSGSKEYFKLYADGRLIPESAYTVEVLGDEMILHIKNDISFSEITVEFAQMSYYNIDVYNSSGIPALPFAVSCQRKG